MRRFVTLVVVLLFSVPFGISISGCKMKTAPVFCNGGDAGPVLGQATTITLLPKVYGISLNYAQIGQISTPTATDCKGNNVTIFNYTYGTTSMTIADVEPTNGRLCAGTWNRNTGGNIPDYTYCNPTNVSGVAYVTVSGAGVTSNPIPVYIHPVVTSIVLGSPTPSCSNTTDPGTDCCPIAVGGAAATNYSATSCLSQGTTAQLIARVYSGTGANQTNITCQSGHLQFSAQNSSVVSIDDNGVVTAQAPGSTLVSAAVANASSSAGYFSTCPPQSIVLTAPVLGPTTNPLVLNLNNTQSLIATVLDTNGKTLTGLSLEYVTTTPSTTSLGSSGVVTPNFAGSTSVSALCQPGTCNPASYNEIGLFGNGKPIVSNSINISTPGTNSTVLYMGSTQSQYMASVDFTTGVLGNPFRLPYVPNSMVISSDGTQIYLGSATELMVLNVVNQVALTREDPNSSGLVLAVSPDNQTVVVADPVRQLIKLENQAGNVISTFGGMGTRAVWAPDSQTVYITAGTQLIVYSTFTGWNSIVPANPVGGPVTDAAVTVPSVGAYFAGQTTTARGYCEASTPTPAIGVPTETNIFYPIADTDSAPIDRIAATNDGNHILGVTATTAVPTLSDLRVSIPVGACPQGTPPLTTTSTAPGLTFTHTLLTSLLTPITATSITGVLPASDSSIAFVTYKGTGGVLPAYAPALNGLGTTTYIKLSGTATAPIAGAISADTNTVYVGTSGDNLVHIINRGTLTDSSTLAPALSGINGGTVPVDLITQKPRKTT